MKKILLLLILLGLGGGLYVFLKPGKEIGTKAPAEQKFDAPVERRTIATSVEIAGDVKPEKQVEVKPEISARVLKIYVKEGDQVKAGDPLVDLDATELNTEKSAAETEIAIAELELGSAERDYQREARLKENRLVTERKYDEASTAVELAKKKLLRSRQRLDNILSKLSKTRILAPLDGTVLSLPVVEGQVVVGAASVNAGTVLMTVADLSRLIINCHVNQVDVAKISPGMAFDFGVDSLEGVKMQGQIASIAPISTLKNNVKGFSVDLKILSPDPRLRPGMTADVSIPTGKVTDVLSVPVTAVFSNNGKRVAYLKPKAGEPVETEITVGLTNTEFAEVRAGLSDGDRVLIVRPENLPKS